MLLVALFSIVIPLGLDLYLPTPESNPLTTEKVERGRRLFSDRRLSRDRSIACSTCHDPKRGFADNKPIAIGIGGRAGRRNTPAIINRGYGRALFWDGRETTLESQVLRPIEDPNEMDFTANEAAARVGLARDDLANALASFVRSVLSGNSRFDRFVYGERSALTDEEQRGLQTFRGKGNCSSCHNGPTLTDERFHNTGVAWRPDGSAIAEPRGSFHDPGRFHVTGNEADRGAFKTPTLRDVSLTAPYMHDGSLATLDDVVTFYDQGGRANPNLDMDIRPLKLAPEEKRALVAFLSSLAGESAASRPK
jgi:cytochrome c peroxidase